MIAYKPKDIEAKWQKIWQESQIYRVDLKTSDPKFYGFGMFNYPSGGGIHLGHVKNFVLPDVLSRIKRQQGVAVYCPVGFDTFGLPAENYALKTGQKPQKTTQEAISRYREQYQALGFSFDWSKEIDTSQKDYYRWTQWCFLKLLEAGLAYQKESEQWWCQQCLTILADEQVNNGRCWRHDAPDDPLATKKRLKQWFFKITNYADKLLEATSELDWTPWVKVAQKNYIGRSEGLDIDFDLVGLDFDNQKLTVFTTAVETIYGATFMVLAPEHSLLEKIAAVSENQEEVLAYIKAAKNKSEVNRQQAKEKTGVLLKGLLAKQPLTGELLPIYVADYVLAGYGHGAIMAVPGGDRRDFDFAKKFGLKISYPTTKNKFINYSQLKTDLDDHYLKLPPEAANDPESTSLAGKSLATVKTLLEKRLVSQGLAKKTISYHLRDWLVSRQRYWGCPIPVIYCPKCGPQPVREQDLPVELPDLDDYRPSGDGQGPLSRASDWLAADCPKCKEKGRRETDTLDTFVCSSWYQYRYLAANNQQEAWNQEIANHWLPVDFYNGGDHVTAHLIYARFFGHFFADQGYLKEPEPFKKMYFHGKIVDANGQNFSKSKGNAPDPLEIIDQGYGADALRVYVCFMGPPNIEVAWEESGVPAAYRFLSRCYVLIKDYCQNRPNKTELGQSEKLLKALEKTRQNYESSIKRTKLNTAIASLMEFVNQLYIQRREDNFVSQAWGSALDGLIILLAPFAPHLASEAWQMLGHEDQVHKNHWLKKKAVSQEELVTIGVTINGRRRGEITIAANASQEEALAAAKQIKDFGRYLKQPLEKVVYIPKKILNLVLKD